MDHPDLIDIHNMDNLKSLHQLTNNLHHNVDNIHQVTSTRNNVDNLSLGGRETGGVSYITKLYIVPRTKPANRQEKLIWTKNLNPTTSSLQGCRWDDLAEEEAQEYLPHDDLRYRCHRGHRGHCFQC